MQRYGYRQVRRKPIYKRLPHGVKVAIRIFAISCLIILLDKHHLLHLSKTGEIITPPILEILMLGGGEG